MVTEQLLNTLPSEVRIWVGERKPKTSKEAAALADDHLQARRMEGDHHDGTNGGNENSSFIHCNICRKVGHVAKD